VFTGGDVVQFRRQAGEMLMALKERQGGSESTTQHRLHTD
jgi:hypothetical protein